MQQHPYGLILTAMTRLQEENAELKKQNASMKLQNISSAVAERIDTWLSRPYNRSDESQDIKDFSVEITSFIASQLKI